VQPLLFLIYCAAGVTIGLFYFGGLWWTVNKMTSASNLQLLFFASFVVRTAFTLIAFYYILAAGWLYLVIALGGFLAARLIVTASVKNSKNASLS